MQVLDALAEARAAKRRKNAEQQALSALFVAADPAESAEAGQHEDKKRKRAAPEEPSGGGQLSCHAPASTFSFGFAIGQ